MTPPDTRPHSVDLPEAQLYLLATETVCPGPWMEAVEAALVGGVQLVQLREKRMTTAERVTRARALVELCARHGARLVVNDDVDAALAGGAWGLHVGQEDVAPEEARRRLAEADRPRVVIGVSTHDEDELSRALAAGADYVGVGSAFPTDTKGRAVPVRGPEALTRLAARAEAHGVPAFAIGGITVDNVDRVVAAGIRRVAVCAGVLATDDPEASARRLRDALG